MTKDTIILIGIIVAILFAGGFVAAWVHYGSKIKAAFDAGEYAKAQTILLTLILIAIIIKR